jgi:CheY-like chemotaxis protein
LIVEDNDASRDALARRFARRAYRVVVARDGGEGVALAIAERPDIILMDLGLPVMDGWDATRTLKADARTRDIPVVVLSAHAMAADREAALSAGADEFDTKPVRFEHLLGLVDGLLRRKSA